MIAMKEVVLVEQTMVAIVKRMTRGIMLSAAAARQPSAGEVERIVKDGYLDILQIGSTNNFQIVSNYLALKAKMDACIQVTMRYFAILLYLGIEQYVLKLYMHKSN